jgi:hypothetical protein
MSGILENSKSSTYSNGPTDYDATLRKLLGTCNVIIYCVCLYV